MANYCKKSSIESVVSEVKTKAGISQSTPMPFADIADTISSLVIPTQRGSPSVSLNTSKTQHTIQRGVYTGGSVSVTAYQGTAQPQADSHTIYPESGKVFSSVIIPASNVYTTAKGTLKPTSSNKATFTVSGLSFQPVGICIVISNATSSGVSDPNIGAYLYINSTTYGLAASSSNYAGDAITSATVSITNTSIAISNIKAGNTSLTFDTRNYAYFVWG